MSSNSQGDIRKSDHNEILAGSGGVKLKRSQEGLDTKLLDFQYHVS